MGSPSKENQILELFLGYSPVKHWHFEEIVRKAKVTKVVANKWIKKYQRQGVLKRVKERGKFPYFVCGKNNLEYQSIKRFYGLNKIYKCGLMSHLMKLKAKTVIIFGSIAKGDWYKDSDIDIFIYGSINNLNKSKYELKLHKDIETHVFETKNEIKNIKSGLINNIINGYIVKGSIQDFVKINNED